MRHLQQPFTRWYNRTRSKQRRGPLWANRFRNTLLQPGLAVWDCWKYLIMNPARANIVREPADYRFGSYGIWSAAGRHAFHTAVVRQVLPWLSGLLSVEDMGEVRTELRKDIAHVTAIEAGHPTEAVKTAIAVAGQPEPLSTRIDRRVRYWVDGLVIGSDLFVLNTVANARIRFCRERRRLTRAVGPDREPLPLCAFKQLRTFLL